MSPRLLRPRASGTAVHPEAVDWATRVTANGGTVSSNTLAAVSTFCASIDAAGIRDRFYRLNLFCGDQLAAALVPLYRAESSTASARGNATDTNNNFVSGDFNNTGASAGLKGNASNKYLATGYLPNTLPATNTHLAVALFAGEPAAGSDRTLIGAATTSGTTVFAIDSRRPTLSTGQNQCACALGLYTSSFAGFFGEAVHSPPLAAGTIVASAGTQYRNGSEAGIPPVSLANYSGTNSLFVLATNVTNGTPANFSEARIGAYSAGAAMTASQVVAFTNALAAFNATLSRA
jgi:hypothetical protein